MVMVTEIRLPRCKTRDILHNFLLSDLVSSSFRKRIFHVFSLYFSQIISKDYLYGRCT